MVTLPNPCLSLETNDQKNINMNLFIEELEKEKYWWFLSNTDNGLLLKAGDPK